MMNRDNASAGTPPVEDDPSPQPQLSDDDITRMVDHEMGATGLSATGSNSILLAFGVTLAAFLYVGILVLSRVQPLEIARASDTPVAASASSVSSAPHWVNWTYSLEEGQSRAHQSHSKILIDFYTDWCPDCKWADSTVYTRPDVLAESQNVAMVKINAEGRRDLAQRYGIREYPTFVWTDENGNLTARQDGNTSAEQFASLMARNR